VKAMAYINLYGRVLICSSFRIVKYM